MSLTSDDKNGRLCEAAYQNDLEGARAALADGADVRARVARGGHPACTPLAWARTAAMATLLLDAGADVDAEDAEGYTPLFRLLSHEWLEPVEVLLERGADPNHAASPQHDSPVDRALLVSPQAGLRLLQAGGRIGPKTRAKLWLHREALALLDEWPILGAPLPDRDKQLMLAARARDLDTVKRLLGEGASVTARDTEGASALDHALRKGHIAIARVLERADLATLDGARAFLLTLDDFLESHQAKAFDLEARTPRGMTALMLAARYRRHGALRVLLQLGANLEQRNGASTPLVHAIESGDLHGMLQLLDHGAVMNLQIDGENPVLGAAIRQPDSDLLEHLLARGIEVPAGQYTKLGETGRLLQNALAGLRPYVGPPEFSSWSECKICRDLPEAMGWCQTTTYTGDGIPAVTEQRFERYAGDLWKCPHCATYYDYQRYHDSGLDSEDLRRISLDVARKRLEGMAGPREARELARATYAPALEAPGKKVYISGDEVKDGKRVLLIYELAPGAKRIAWHRVLDSEHDAVVADLSARGLEQAETDFDSMNDYVWIRRAPGIEVYDATRKVLEVAGDRATLADGAVILRADVARVIAYASEDEVERGVKVVLRSGAEVELVYDYSVSAEVNYQYNRNDLLFETVWCALIGHEVARWAGTTLENLI